MDFNFLKDLPPFEKRALNHPKNQNNNNNNSKDFFQIFPLQQIDNDSCGFHSLKNSIILLNLFSKEANKEKLSFQSLLDTDLYWKWFFNWREELLKEANKNPSEIFTEKRIGRCCLEDEYADYLFENSLMEYRDKVTLIPELSYIAKSQFSVSKIQSISEKIQLFHSKETNFHAFIISGVPYHWTSLVVLKNKKKLNFFYFDSFQTPAGESPISFSNFLSSGFDFCEYYLEQVLYGLIQDIFGDSLLFLESNCPYTLLDIKITCGDKSGRLRKIVGLIRELGIQYLSQNFTDMILLWSNFLKTGISKFEKVSKLFTYWTQISQSILKIIISTPLLKNLLEKPISSNNYSELEKTFCFYENRKIGIASLYYEKSKIGGDIVLQDQSLEFIPDFIGLEKNLDHVTSLILSDNKIHDIQSVTYFTNLKKLDCSSNNLFKLPLEIFQKCQKLEILSVGKNNITYIPSEIEFLVHLKILNLSQNNLSNLPDSLTNLKNLQTLILLKNNFIQIPFCLLKMEQLKALDFSFNPLTEIPDNFVKDLKSLTVLYLEGTNIKNIEVMNLEKFILSRK